MKNYSRTPTEENVLKLLKRNPIGRTEDVLRFVELLSNMEDACYSIALNGEWGSGKTFFVKQVKLILDAQNPQSNIPEKTRNEIKRIVQNRLSVPGSYTSVYYDAWANDNHEDPLLSLIYEVIHSGQSSYTPERERNLCTAISNIADLLTGRNVSDVLNDLRGKDKLENIQKYVKNIKSVSENSSEYKKIYQKFIDENNLKEEFKMADKEFLKEIFKLNKISLKLKKLNEDKAYNNERIAEYDKTVRLLREEIDRLNKKIENISKDEEKYNKILTSRRIKFLKKIKFIKY